MFRDCQFCFWWCVKFEYWTQFMLILIHFNAYIFVTCCTIQNLEQFKSPKQNLEKKVECVYAYLLSNYCLLDLFFSGFFQSLFSLWHLWHCDPNQPPQCQRADFLLMRVNMLLCRAPPAPLTSQAAVLLLKQSKPFFARLSAKSS